jgi:hypothetical protein
MGARSQQNCAGVEDLTKSSRRGAIGGSSRRSRNTATPAVDGRDKPGQGGEKGRWTDFFGNLLKTSDNFMIDRDQGIAEEREPLC